MPWVHRRNLFLTVSASTFTALQEIGVDTDRIRLICNGVEPGPPPAPRSPEPMFLAFGRLAEYKRIDLLLRLWDRVRQVTGGRLVIAGDGPQRARLESMAGPDVEFTGRVSEAEKHRLMSAAWLLLHRPASRRRIVVSGASRHFCGDQFSVPGLGVPSCMARPGCWCGPKASSPRRASMASTTARRDGLPPGSRRGQHWSAAVDRFALVADEGPGQGGVAIHEARRSR